MSEPFVNTQRPRITAARRAAAHPRAAKGRVVAGRTVVLGGGEPLTCTIHGDGVSAHDQAGSRGESFWERLAAWWRGAAAALA